MTGYTESNAAGILQNRYSITYNARGQVTYEETSQKKGTDTYLGKVTNSYNAQITVPNYRDSLKNPPIPNWGFLRNWGFLKLSR